MPTTIVSAAGFYFDLNILLFVFAGTVGQSICERTGYVFSTQSDISPAQPICDP